jgi:hypothetical protein
LLIGQQAHPKEVLRQVLIDEQAIVDI